MDLLWNNQSVQQTFETNNVTWLFAALANRTRLRILNLLNGREVCLCHLVEVLELDRHRISHHLERLSQLGIVLERRQGSWTHYRLNPGKHFLLPLLLKDMAPAFKRDQAMEADLLKLVKASCAPLQLPFSSEMPLLILMDATCSGLPS
jgi:ArsR family transcriptional regulator